MITPGSLSLNFFRGALEANTPLAVAIIVDYKNLSTHRRLHSSTEATKAMWVRQIFAMIFCLVFVNGYDDSARYGKDENAIINAMISKLSGIRSMPGT